MSVSGAASRLGRRSWKREVWQSLWQRNARHAWLQGRHASSNVQSINGRTDDGRPPNDGQGWSNDGRTADDGHDGQGRSDDGQPPDDGHDGEGCPNDGQPGHDAAHDAADARTAARRSPGADDGTAATADATAARRSPGAD